MNDLIYTTNPETKTIRCTVQNCRKDFMRITDKILSQYPERIRYFYRFIAFYHCEELIKDEYTGKSVCSSEDIFDEKYGRDVARTKAIIKRETAFNHAIDVIFDDLDTLMDVNVTVDRDSVLDKHLDNLYTLLGEGKALAQIRGYDQDKNDEYGIADDIDLNKAYTPHCCSLCGKTFLNYTDDADYSDNEAKWQAVCTFSGLNLELCSDCVKVVETLS